MIDRIKIYIDEFFNIANNQTMFNFFPETYELITRLSKWN